MSFRSLRAFSALQSWIPQVFRAFTVQLSSSVRLNENIHFQGKIYRGNIWKSSPEFIDETFQISIECIMWSGKLPTYHGICNALRLTKVERGLVEDILNNPNLWFPFFQRTVSVRGDHFMLFLQGSENTSS